MRWLSRRCAGRRHSRPGEACLHRGAFGENASAGNRRGWLAARSQSPARRARSPARLQARVGSRHHRSQAQDRAAAPILCLGVSAGSWHRACENRRASRPAQPPCREPVPCGRKRQSALCGKSATAHRGGWGVADRRPEKLSAAAVRHIRRQTIRRDFGRIPESAVRPAQAHDDALGTQHRF